MPRTSSWGSDPRDRLIVKSGYRESNPDFDHGKVIGYHYIISARSPPALIEVEVVLFRWPYRSIFLYASSNTEEGGSGDECNNRHIVSFLRVTTPEHLFGYSAPTRSRT